MQKRFSRPTAGIEQVFVLLLFFVFSAALLSVVLLGAGVYKNIADSMQQNRSVAASSAYIATKLRQNDQIGGATLKALEGQTALVLHQTFEASDFENWIYFHEGYLMEVLVAKNTEFAPETGQKILQLENFELQSTADNLLKITATLPQGAQLEWFAGTRAANLQGGDAVD